MRVNKKISVVSILAIIAIALGVYFYWYVPRQPLYTMRLLQTAVEKGDTATVYKHVDVPSVVGHAIDDLIDADPRLKNNPWTAILKPLAKEAGTAIIKDAVETAMRQRAEKQSAHQEKAAEETSATAADNPLAGEMEQWRDAYDKAGVQFLPQRTEVMQSEDGTATVRLVGETQSPKEEIPVELRLRQLDDGTWQIFEISNFTDVLKHIQAWEQQAGR